MYYTEQAEIYFIKCFIGFSIYLWSFVVHEAGHVLYMRLALKRKVSVLIDKKITVGGEYDYKGLNKASLVKIYLAGILAGMIPIFAAAVINQLWLFMLIPYMVHGSYADLNKIWMVCKHDRTTI